MKTLHIIASPRGERSKSRELGDYTAAKLNSTVEVLDLNTLEVPFLSANILAYNYGFMKYEDLSTEDKKIADVQSKFVAQVKQADNIVISAPLWNFDMPAILKAYFDLILKVGETFIMGEAGFDGLLKGKKAYLVFSKGGFYKGLAWESIDKMEGTVTQALNFVGITDIKIFTLEGTNRVSEEETNKNVETLKQEIDKSL